ncbi:hypothetical protein AYR62_15290 [Secundilactobacillus paracollinoides]|uniref:Fido domain-containing protein n=1 Tax=Secundilactobacillus paracollinoides TaxID=240427 RepID=A0A1B2IW43_9LACO|nr:hypothetical protein AYR61_02980 [Secundilactobacillus paracollinoides]ANZ65307.1 hypothetical protein AYR62_15290 [Secundilactobacillus paracollinoides]ANZ66238.1 hypothetical protein AYR63_03185 [Secundilactobacillus paracollinoides]
MDNTALARFISSIGSLNGYGSSLLQTKHALDLNSSTPLNQDSDDVAIFEDALKGITAVRRVGFSVDGIIAINKAFDSDSDEEPNWPGHLRNAYYNEDDRIGIILDEKSHRTYMPPEVVGRNDLQKIVDEYMTSPKKEKDAWRVFVRIAKLQPFQDGNKRTALIAANAAYDTFSRENYLVLPFDELDQTDFMTTLMRYYETDNQDEEEKYFNRLLSLLPSDRERILHKPISPDDGSGKTITFNLKPQIRNRSGKKPKITRKIDLKTQKHD